MDARAYSNVNKAYSNVDKGIKFEIWTAELLRDLGYDRVKLGLPPLRGRSGDWHQIDIVYGLLRTHPVECKYKSPNGWRVGREEIGKFLGALDDLNISPKNSLFVACGYYQEDAVRLGLDRGLTMWGIRKLEKLDRQRLGPMSYLAARVVGRKPLREQILETKIPPALRQYYAIMVKKYGHG